MKIDERVADKLTKAIMGAIMRSTLTTRTPRELVPVAHALYATSIRQIFHPDATTRQYDRLADRLGEVAREWIEEVKQEKAKARTITPAETHPSAQTKGDVSQ